MKKRMMALLLSLIMAFSLLPTSALAAGITVEPWTGDPSSASPYDGGSSTLYYTVEQGKTNAIFSELPLHNYQGNYIWPDIYRYIIRTEKISDPNGVLDGDIEVYAGTFPSGTHAGKDCAKIKVPVSASKSGTVTVPVTLVFYSTEWGAWEQHTYTYVVTVENGEVTIPTSYNRAHELYVPVGYSGAMSFSQSAGSGRYYKLSNLKLVSADESKATVTGEVESEKDAYVKVTGVAEGDTSVYATYSYNSGRTYTEKINVHVYEPYEMTVEAGDNDDYIHSLTFNNGSLNPSYIQFSANGAPKVFDGADCISVDYCTDSDDGQSLGAWTGWVTDEATGSRTGAVVFNVTGLKEGSGKVKTTFGFSESGGGLHMFVDVVNVTVTSKSTPTEPTAPTTDDVIGLSLGNIVNIDCATANTHDTSYALEKGGFTVGTVSNSEVTITVDKTYYLNKYNGTDGTHTEDTDKTHDLTVTLKYENSAWSLKDSTDTATIYVKCELAPQEPTAPSAAELAALEVVTVDCLNDNVSHADGKYALIAESYTASKVSVGKITYTITDIQPYIDKYDETLSGHFSVGARFEDDLTVTLEYNAASETWGICDKDTATIKVYCKETPVWDPQMISDEMYWEVECVDDDAHKASDVLLSRLNASDYTVSGPTKCTNSNDSIYGEYYFDITLTDPSAYYPEGHSTTTEKTDEPLRIYVRWDNNSLTWNCGGFATGTIYCECEKDWNVYVYFVTQDSAGNELTDAQLGRTDLALKENSCASWHTLGKLETEQKLGAQSYAMDSDAFKAVVAELSTSKFTHHTTENTKITPDMLRYTALKQEYEHFSGYDPAEGSECAYHLDGVLTFYTLTLEGNGGSDVPTTQYSYYYGGEALTLPTAEPTREGYTFKGWSDGTNTYAAGASYTMGSADTTLTAVWEANKYTVTYLLDGKQYGEIDTVTWSEGLECSLRDDPSKTGYTFSGWTSTDVTIDSDGNFVMPTKDVTITGSFTARNDLSYTVHYYLRGTTKKLADDKVVKNQVFGTDVTENAIRIAGYRVWGADEKTVTIDITGNEIVFEYSRLYHPSTPSTPAEPDGTVLRFNTEDHLAYIKGYPDGTVQPDGTITRAEVAMVLYRLMDEKCLDEYYTTRNDFKDVLFGSWYNTCVSTLANAGVIVDSEDGFFRPNEAITRAELAAMLAQFAEIDTAKGTKFTDVSAKHWAAEAIAIVEKLGWIEGYPDGTFRPDETLTRAEMVTMLNRALDREPSSEERLLSADGMITFPDCESRAWYYLAMQEAANSHTYRRIGTEGDEQWIALIK